MWKLSSVIILMYLIENVFCKFTLTEPFITFYKPKGMRVHMPDVEGIVFVAFHGKLNEAFQGTEPGTIESELTKNENGWSYENDDIEFEIGDILSYWMYAQHDKLGYRLEDKTLEVKEMHSRHSGPSITPSTKRPFTRPPVTATEKLSPTVTTVKSTTNCELSITTVKGIKACKGQLIFEENFNNFDSKKWKKEVRIGLDSEDAEFVTYHNNPDVSYVMNNTLFIVPKLLSTVPGFDENKIKKGEINLQSDCTPYTSSHSECSRKAGGYYILPPIVSANIQTKDNFSFKYGKIEVRAKLPIGNWIFPRIHLEPVSRLTYGDAEYSNGQMRVAFIRSNRDLMKDDRQISGNKLSGGLVLDIGQSNRQSWMSGHVHDRHLGEEFHNYSLSWTSTSISVALDGITYASYNSLFKNQAKDKNIQSYAAWLNGETMAPFDKEFYIGLGVGVGGMSDFPDGSTDAYDSLNNKPWKNFDPKAESIFWANKINWLKTWNGLDVGLQVDSVKVWAI